LLLLLLLKCTGGHSKGAKIVPDAIKLTLYNWTWLGANNLGQDKPVI
jgi:hypothetical protein